MTGSEYANLIALYIKKNFGDRNLRIYREVSVGKSIIGKNRRIDIFVINDDIGDAFAIECKFQDTQGTVDEKIPYALNDMRAMLMNGCVAYAGEGFSKGVVHMLQSAEIAAYCLPDAENLVPSKATAEPDHILAQHFGWWDLFVQKRIFRLNFPILFQFFGGMVF